MLNRLFQGAALSVLIAGAASAADLPRRTAPPAYAAVPAFTWTGFYAGTLSGYAFSDDQTVRTSGNNGPNAAGITNTQANVAQGRRPFAIREKSEGLTSFGGGIGYDYQFVPGNGIVVGIAADATAMDLDRRRGFISGLNDISGFRQQLDYLGTVRGRVGYAFDRFLVYGTGGFAFGGVDYKAAFLSNAPGRPLAYAGSFSGMETGYVYGGGVEYAIPADSFLAKFNLLSYLNLFQSQAVTVKAEYLHYDLGSRNVLVNSIIPGGPSGSYTSRFNTEGNVVRGGFTYRFGTL